MEEVIQERGLDIYAVLLFTESSQSRANVESLMCSRDDFSTGKRFARTAAMSNFTRGKTLSLQLMH